MSDNKRPFWQEFILQGFAPTMAFAGVVVSLRPDLLGQKEKTITIARMEERPTGDEKLPPRPLDSIPDFQEIEPTSSTELSYEINSYEFHWPSVSAIGAFIAGTILLVQIIKLYRNWK